MNEQQEQIRAQLDELRAESDALKVEERLAHAHLAQMHKEEQAAMLAYRTIALRQQQVERTIKKLLAKDTRLYVQAQKGKQAV